MESSIYCPNDLFFCEQHFFKHRQPACRYKKLQAQGCRLQAQQNCDLPYFLRNYLVYQVIYLCSCLQVFIYVYVYNTSLVLHFLFFFLHIQKYHLLWMAIQKLNLGWRGWWTALQNTYFMGKIHLWYRVFSFSQLKQLLNYV